MLGLYLHVPFCSSICNYCNFNRGLFESGLKDRYVVALEREILQAGRGEPVDTVYFGGGTPSLLEPEEIGRLIQACRRSFEVTPDAEVTLETNPETSNVVRMQGFRAAGVNRVSFGVQSFRDCRVEAAGPAALGRAGRRGGCRGPGRRVRQRQPGPHDVAAGTVNRQLGGERRAADRDCARARVACTCSSSIPTRRSRKKWRGRAGRRRRTRTPPRCTWAGWRLSTRPGIGSTRFRTSVGQAASLATT